ncbi:UBA-like protein [Niveomyces insectorum RCEF 264]|uniref:UBA-like protein n=1 Tax=Niveomyces insectorum RCEF 264 TaxID=1081102 RepID=A0A167XT11_9HYPO|nr:UBA-like protein [Niveomyces insectorum RCEF 264]
MEPMLPPFAPFPELATWRQQFDAAEWADCMASWLSLVKAHLSLSEVQFASISLKDDAVPAFLSSFLQTMAVSGPTDLGEATAAKALTKGCLRLATRALQSSQCPSSLLQWGFLSDFCHVHGKRRAGQVLAVLPSSATDVVEASLSGLKKHLIKNLESGLHGDLRTVEECLRRVNYLISAWPVAAALFMAGSDYVDALISCFKIMNPPLRKCIVTNLYLCLVGLVDGSTPNYSLLSDLLYALRVAAKEHKKGPLNVNDSLVAELVTVTPVLQQIQQKIDASGSSASRMQPVLADLQQYRKAGGRMPLPTRRIRHKSAKGKAAAVVSEREEEQQQLHVHKLSAISQIQDLFPDLGSGFVMKLLDEYNDDAERVVAHLLEGTLPEHLESADRSEKLDESTGFTKNGRKDSGSQRAGPFSHATTARRHSVLAPRPTPPLLPSRRNVFDDDELDQLALETSHLHFGKQEAQTTADDLLQDRSTAPKTAAILSALAAFDSDDDERDDTYDAADVGGTVDGLATGGEDLHEANEQVLFAAYQATAKVFERDAATRRSDARTRLKEETGMTDEAIEGWGLMLSRNPQQRRRLEIKFSTFSGAQTELARTAWRASSGELGAGDDSGTDGATPSRGGRGGRGYHRGGRGGRGGPRGGGGANVAGPAGEKDTEQARRRKETQKGSRANHNRRDQRARKMARGGFPG